MTEGQVPATSVRRKHPSSTGRFSPVGGGAARSRRSHTQSEYSTLVRLGLTGHDAHDAGSRSTNDALRRWPPTC